MLEEELGELVKLGREEAWGPLEAHFECGCSFIYIEDSFGVVSVINFNFWLKVSVSFRGGIHVR